MANMVPTALFLLCLLAGYVLGLPQPQEPQQTQGDVPNVFFTVDARDGKTFTHSIEKGPLRAGQPFTVKYNPMRGQCEHIYKYGADTWAVFVGFKNAEGSFDRYDVVAYVEPHSNITVAPVVDLPPMPAGPVALWFLCTNYANRNIYDSNFGKNWMLQVE